MLLHIDCRGNNEKRIAVFVCCVLVVRIMYAHHVLDLPLYFQTPVIT